MGQQHNAGHSVTQLRSFTDEERGWVAGILEGEGHFGALKVGRPLKDGRHPYRCRASVAQTGRELLDRLVEVTGVGRIYGPYRTNHGGAGQAYHWMVQRSIDVDALVCSVFVLLTRRRQEQIVGMYDKAATPA